jgi:transaldolase
MIKVPATPAGLEAIEAMVASGLTLNVTLIFTRRQYELARDAVWRGALKRATREPFKSVYSIFVSRVDVYTAKHVPQLSPQAQGLAGIVNAKRLWQLNQSFWREKQLPLKQEIIFASTGVKTKGDPDDKYVAALAGADIQTNPPATNQAVERLGKRYDRQVDQMPSESILSEIDSKVDQAELERVLMEEGVAKFADPHQKLLATIREKRSRSGVGNRGE